MSKKNYTTARERSANTTKTIAILAALIVLGIAFTIGISFLSPNLHSEEDPRFREVFDYSVQLADEGLLQIGELDLTSGGQIIVYVAANDDIPISEREKIFATVVAGSHFFSSINNFNGNGLNLDFQHPKAHALIFINRDDGLPTLLRETNEVTVSSPDDPVNDIGVSIINLGGMQHELGEEYGRDSLTLQAVCLAFSLNKVDNDAICNILSRNATFGYLGYDEEFAQNYMDNLGRTQLAYIGNTDYDYRYIPLLYSSFLDR